MQWAVKTTKDYQCILDMVLATQMALAAAHGHALGPLVGVRGGAMMLAVAWAPQTLLQILPPW